ncbi:MAG: NAD(P)-dependent oxidoreductase [Acetobacteraceae bacterium]
MHLAGIDRSVATDDALTMQVNAIGTWNLFEAALRNGVRRVVHCSSSSALGLDASNPRMPPRYLPIDEAHPLRPTDAYGLSKLCGEQIAEAASRRGLEVIVIRPCFVAFPEMADFMAGRPDRRDGMSRCPTCGPMSDRRTVRAASSRRRPSRIRGSRHSSWPPKPRSRRNRPSIVWSPCTGLQFRSATRHSTRRCLRPRRSAMRPPPQGCTGIPNNSAGSELDRALSVATVYDRALTIAAEKRVG